MFGNERSVWNDWKRWLIACCLSATSGLALAQNPISYGRVPQYPPCEQYQSPCPPFQQYLSPSPFFEPEVSPPSPREDFGAEPLPETPLEGRRIFDGGECVVRSGETEAKHPGGYIDSAIPRARVQFRFDAGFDNPRPDRAEFFYAKCGCFRAGGIDPSAAGPGGANVVETSLDYQELWAQLECALTSDLSLFGDVPVRFLQGEQIGNFDGLSDVQFGVKTVLARSEKFVLSAALRVYAPSGDSQQGLGTDHYSLEPELLWNLQATDNLTLFGEFRDWIPIDANEGPVEQFGPDVSFSGNILRYGIGAGYDLLKSDLTVVTPVVELVGWTILQGQASSPSGVEDQDGVSIVNLKFGARFTFRKTTPIYGYGDGGQPPWPTRTTRTRSSLYVGYGFALSDEAWYQDIVRVEYGWTF